MKRRALLTLRCMVLAAAAWSLAAWVAVSRAQGSESLVMICNKSVGGDEAMTTGVARKILLGETAQWGGKGAIVVLPPPGDPLRAGILKKICSMSEQAFTRYRMQLAFTGGEPSRTEEAASDTAVKNMIKANPGALGFVHRSAADATVKVLLEIE